MKTGQSTNKRSLKSSLKSLSFLWGGSFLGSGSTFLLYIILAREFGPNEFGVFSSAFSIVTILSLLAGFGVSQFWLKAFGKEGWEGIRWLKPSFLFVTITLFIITGFIVLLYVLNLNDDGTENLLLVLCFYIYGYISIDLVSSKLQLEERFMFLSFWQLSSNLLRLLLVLLSFYVLNISLSIFQVGLIYALVGFLFTILSLFKLRKMSSGEFKLKGHLDKVDIKVVIPKLRHVLSETWPFGLGTVFAFIYIQSDIIMVKYIAGNVEAGYYNTAFVILTGVLVLPSIIFGKFLLVKYHRWANSDQEKLYLVYKKGNISMFILGVLLMLIILGTSSYFIPILFGIDYNPSIALVNILALTLPFSFLSYSVGATLVTKDNMKFKVKLMGLIALFNVLLNSVLISSFGAKGAAISTVVSNVLLLFLYHRAVNKKVFMQNKNNI